MASFMSTMFVSSPKSPSFPKAAEPLPPVSTLTESSSYIHIPPIETPSPFTPSKFLHFNFPSPPIHHTPSPSPSPKSSPLRNLLQSIQPPFPLPGLHSQSPAYRTLLTCAPPNSNDKARKAGPSGNATTSGPFRPQNRSRGTTSWQLRQFAEATLGNGSLKKAVKLPEGEDLNEWLAVNVVDFYNQIHLLYGSITEFCSPTTCPEMKATDEFEYLWADPSNPLYQKPTKVPAPTYIDLLLTWTSHLTTSEDLFPSRLGAPFPRSFPSTVKQIFKRLYRVYAHVYCHHYEVVVRLGLEPHLNTSFKHFCLFVCEFGLERGQRDYWGPLGDLVGAMVGGEGSY